MLKKSIVYRSTDRDFAVFSDVFWGDFLHDLRGDFLSDFGDDFMDNIFTLFQAIATQ